MYKVVGSPYQIPSNCLKILLMLWGQNSVYKLQRKADSSFELDPKINVYFILHFQIKWCLYKRCSFFTCVYVNATSCKTLPLFAVTWSLHNSAFLCCIKDLHIPLSAVSWTLSKVSHSTVFSFPHSPSALLNSMPLTLFAFSVLFTKADASLPLN